MNSTQEASDIQRTINPNRMQMKTFKVIVLGDSGVGKTCLTYRFCEGKFLDSPELTIGVDFRERIVDIDGENIKVMKKNYASICYL